MNWIKGAVIPGTLLALPVGLNVQVKAAGTQASGKPLTTAYVACNFYAQYPSGKNWQFYISRVGKIQTGTGELWPDSPSDRIAKTWADYLRQAGADVDLLGQGQYADFPVCHGFNTAEEAEKTRVQWLDDLRKGKGGYTVHEEEWTPSGTNR
jgi:hypothetical protein